jgi:hypothetical protein
VYLHRNRERSSVNCPISVGIVPESELSSGVIRITTNGQYAMKDNGVVGGLRAIDGEKRTKYVSL